METIDETKPMRILLDNCVNHRLASRLRGHIVQHARSEGWHELANGVLTRTAAAAGYSVLVTVDQNLRKQHDLANMPLCVVTLQTKSITMSGLEPLIEPLLSVLSSLDPATTRDVVVGPQA